MPFEIKGIRVVQPLDPYTEDDAFEGFMVDQIYTLTIGMRDDYVNPIANSPISWRSICSFDTNSKEALHNQQEHNHELYSRRCTNIRAIKWIGAKLRYPPVYDRTGDIEVLLDQMKQKLEEDKLNPSLDVHLKATLA